MAKFTFRSQALEKLASPEQLDQLVRVTTLKNWLGLVGLACLLAPLAAWGMWGSLETRVAAQGLLLPAGGLCVVSAPDDGQVTEILALPGQQVQAGEIVVRIQRPDAVSKETDQNEVAAPCEGKVAAQQVRPGDPVKRASTLLIIEPAGRALEVVAYFPLEAARAIAPGMPVRISPAAMQKEIYGYLIGSVVSVEQYPISPERLILQAGSETLAHDFLQQGILVEVHIALIRVDGQVQWTLSRANVPPLLSGTPCTLFVITDRRAPLQLIFPDSPPEFLFRTFVE